MGAGWKFEGHREGEEDKEERGADFDYGAGHTYAALRVRHFTNLAGTTRDGPSMLTLLGYALKNLRRQKLRTLLAATGVMLGVWLVVVFSAVSAGAMRTAQAMLTEFGEDFHCYKAGVADQFLSSLDNRESREKLRAIPGVAGTSSVLVWFTTVPGAKIVFLVGLTEDEFALKSLTAVSFGGEDGVFLGKRLADRLGKSVGDELVLEGHVYRVAGMFTTGKPLYDNSVVLPLSTMQRDFRNGEDVANFIAVRIDDGADAASVADLVEERIPEISVVRTLEDLSKVDQGLERMQMWSLVISVVATIIGLLFVMLAMVMVVFERVREVGILRAVGWTKGKIVTIVLIEALLLSVVGVLVGIPTGLLGVELISWLTDLGTFIEPEYELALYLKALLVALLAAGFGGIYPAWRAARLRPVEAIRHE
jgi:putative ABC transport system permease protein